MVSRSCCFYWVAARCRAPTRSDWLAREERVVKMPRSRRQSIGIRRGRGAKAACPKYIPCPGNKSYQGRGPDHQPPEPIRRRETPRPFPGFDKAGHNADPDNHRQQRRPYQGNLEPGKGPPAHPPRRLRAATLSNFLWRRRINTPGSPKEAPATTSTRGTGGRRADLLLTEEASRRSYSGTRPLPMHTVQRTVLPSYPGQPGRDRSSGCVKPTSEV